MCALKCGQEHETHIQRTTREQEERIAAMQREFMTQIARASEGHSRELDELQAEHAQEVGARVCVRRDHPPLPPTPCSCPSHVLDAQQLVGLHSCVGPAFPS